MRIIRLLPFLLLALSARAATVQTLDGLTLYGRIQLEPSGSLLVTPSNAPAVRVAVSDLLRADFSQATNTAPPLSPRLKPAVLDENRGALPAPWQSADIGQLEQQGSAAHYHGKFTAEVSRGSQQKTEEGFHFVYQSFRGDGEIIVRIASITPRDDKDRQAVAGVTMRAGVETEANSVRLTLTGSGSISFRRRNNSTNSMSTVRRPDRKPPYWLKLTREGKILSAHHSTDGRRWEFVGEAEVVLPERMLVGFLVASRRRDVEGRAEFDHVTLRALEPRASYTPRLVLRDGTVIADHFGTVDDTVVNLSKEKQGLRLLTRQVARLVFRPIDDPELVPTGRAGVLLATGDFVDGDFQCVTNGKVVLTSILFGQRSFALDRKVTAVILRDTAPPPAVFEVKTLDGSIWRAKSITAEAGALQINSALISGWRIAAAELKEITRLP